MPSPNPAKRTGTSRDQDEAASTALLLLLLRQMHDVPHYQSDDEALAVLAPPICSRKR